MIQATTILTCAASELAAARAEIAKLQRVLGKKTLENKILKEAVECAAAKNGWRAHMCTIGATAARTGAMPAEGERQRSAQGSPRVNPKRAYRVTAQAGLLLPKTPRRRPSSRKHEGTVTVGRRNGRWCCDGLEIRCDSGQTVTATFAKDCGDREVFSWRAWEGNGLPGEPVRELLIEAVDKRFGSLQALPADHRLAFLSDNSSACIAADTRALARSLGLRPINTPVCSPQSNGIAEHFNEVHPHSSLKMRSPREFRRHPAAQARRSTVQEAV